MPWYTTDDARRDAEKQAAAKIDPLQNPGVQGLAQLGRNAIDRTSSLERTIATLQMRLRRAGQLLIEEIGADGPESADDTAERAAGVIRRQADAIAALSSQLGNLLAVIHRDGGHYESEYGTEKACADAMQRICDTRARLGAADELAMLVRRLARALQKAAPDNDLPKTAMDYLSIAGFAGSPMRKETA